MAAIFFTSVMPPAWERSGWMMSTPPACKSRLKSYFEKAREICAKYGVKVCDLYPVWEQMEKLGIDVTELLANKLNHPIREIHYYMAIKLIETMLLD